jgi:hypothetical protein
VLLAHDCNPSYSGGRDQEDCGSKPAGANSLGDPISKIPNTKRSGGVAQGVGPEFKPWYHKKKRRKCTWVNTHTYMPKKKLEGSPSKCYKLMWFGCGITTDLTPIMLLFSIANIKFFLL